MEAGVSVLLLHTEDRERLKATQKQPDASADTHHVVDARPTLDQVSRHFDVVVDDGFHQRSPEVFVLSVHVGPSLAGNKPPSLGRFQDLSLEGSGTSRTPVQPGLLSRQGGDASWTPGESVLYLVGQKPWLDWNWGCFQGVPRTFWMNRISLWDESSPVRACSRSRADLSELRREEHNACSERRAGTMGRCSPL